MIGLDTNVLVRYLTQDDPEQSAQASRLVEQELTASEPGFISLVVLAEVCWVLTSLYSASPEEIRQMVQGLLGGRQFHLERRDVVQAAVNRSAGGKAGFVDFLIVQVADAEGCSRVVTFDKAATRDAGMTLLGPAPPRS